MKLQRGFAIVFQIGGNLYLPSSYEYIYGVSREESLESLSLTRWLSVNAITGATTYGGNG